MCGIAGIIGCDIKPRTHISAMLAAIAHRGPDDEDVLTDGCATLGHRRLSIIDLAGGRQPISNHDNSLHIVCNGEIYNWVELRKSLEQAGYRFKTKSDTEVILHLYAEHGTDCLKYLRGMFAFAIWDSKRKRLFAARDHLGQKPLFYATVNGEFLFASEIKALTAVSPELRKMSAEAMDQYLAVRIMTAATQFRARSRSTDRREAMMMRYFGSLALRIRVHRFRTELVQVVGLLVVLGLLIAAHRRY